MPCLRRNLLLINQKIKLIYNLKKVDVLTDICINGTQSIIRRKALYGFHKEASQAFELKQRGIKGFGLLDTARFHLTKKKDSQGLSQEFFSKF